MRPDLPSAKVYQSVWVELACNLLSPVRIDSILPSKYLARLVDLADACFSCLYEGPRSLYGGSMFSNCSLAFLKSKKKTISLRIDLG